MGLEKLELLAQKLIQLEDDYDAYEFADTYDDYLPNLDDDKYEGIVGDTMSAIVNNSYEILNELEDMYYDVEDVDEEMADNILSLMDEVEVYSSYTPAERVNENRLLEAYLDKDEEFEDFKTSEANLDSCDIFDVNKAEASYYQDFLDPSIKEYLKNNKNKKGEIVMMTPNEYYDACSKGFGLSVSRLKDSRNSNPEYIQHLKDVILKYNKKFPLCNIDYTCGGYNGFGQEGLHRMYVAGELCGWNTKFPVLVIDFYDKEEAKELEDEQRKSKQLNQLEDSIKSLELTDYNPNNPADLDTKLTFEDIFYDQFSWLEDWIDFDFNIESDETGENINFYSMEFPNDPITIPMKEFGLYDDETNDYITFNTYQEAEEYINRDFG